MIFKTSRFRNPEELQYFERDSELPREIMRAFGGSILSVALQGPLNLKRSSFREGPLKGAP